MATNPDHIDDQMLLFSQLCSGHYTNPPQGESRGRRRRKKSKGDGAGLELKKRRLSAAQVNFLEMNFGDEHKLESGRKARLATELGLDPKQVAVWFQNRRARWKSKKLEEEYVALKKMHGAVVVEKCQLEEEVLKLKEQLAVAEKEITKLSERSDGVSVGERSCSPSSSFSIDAHHQAFLGDYRVQDDADFLYTPEYNCINGMEWANFHALW